MKQLLLFLFLILWPVSTSNNDAEYVYICTGRYSSCYHKTDKCEGLDNCSRQIKKITLDEAKKLNRRPCKYCCK